MAFGGTYFRGIAGIGNRPISVLGRFQRQVLESPPLDGKTLRGWDSCRLDEFNNPRSHDRDGYPLELGTFTDRFGLCLDIDYWHGVQIYSSKADQTSQRMDDPELCGHVCLCLVSVFEQLSAHRRKCEFPRTGRHFDLGILGDSIVHCGDGASVEQEVAVEASGHMKVLLRLCKRTKSEFEEFDKPVLNLIRKVIVKNRILIEYC